MPNSIVILTQYFYPEMGAPQTRLLELARELAKRGWDVEIITALPNYPTGRIFKVYKGKVHYREKFESLNIYRYWMYPSNSRSIFPRTFSMISFSIACLFSCIVIRRKKPDYIFVESPPLLLGLSAIFLSRFGRSKLVVNISDLWPLSFKELGVLKTGIIYGLLERIEKTLYKSSFLITGQSNEIVEYIKKVVPGKKIHLFRNGVNAMRFRSEQSPYKNPHTNLKLVYAGLIGVAQGIPELCMNINFKEINAEFHIYGDGPECNFFKKEKNLEDRNVYYHGEIDRKRITELLPTYDAALISLKKSIYGAVPSKIYEAMASGLPIFFSGNGEGARIIEDNDCGWVNNSGDYDLLRSNIMRFGSQWDLISQKKNNCLKAASNTFDRKIQIDKLEHTLLDSL